MMVAMRASDDGPLESLRALMKQRNIDLYIVPTEDEHMSEWTAPCYARRQYITGFTGSAGVAVITAAEAVLATDGRYYEQAERQLGSSWTLLRQGQIQVLTWQAWTAHRARHGGRVAIDPRVIAAPEARKLAEQVQACGGAGLLALEDNLVDLVWASSRPESSHHPLRIHAEQYAGKCFRQKLKELRAMLGGRNCTGMLITMLDEVAWLFNLRGGDVPYNPVFQAYALIMDSSVILYIDPEKISPAVSAYLANQKVTQRPYDSIVEDLRKLNEVQAVTQWSERAQLTLSQERQPELRIAVSTKTSWAIHRALGIAASIKELRSPVADLKALKNETELHGMRACHIRDGAAQIEFFAWLENEVRRGRHIDEAGAAEVLRRFRSKHLNFVELSFPTISASGPNAAIIHYEPHKGSCSPIDDRHIYLCDTGAQYSDGTTDATRTLHFGTPSPAEKRAYTLVLKGQIALSTAKFPADTSGFALDCLARQFLWRYQLNYPHGTGHGVGSHLNVHEGPIGIGARRQYAEVALGHGNVVSNEPGYYETGSFGVRLENLLIVKKVPAQSLEQNGDFLEFENITMVPYCRALIQIDLLTDEEVSWIDRYHAQVLRVIKEPYFVHDLQTRQWLDRETQPLLSQGINRNEH